MPDILQSLSTSRTRFTIGIILSVFGLLGGVTLLRNSFAATAYASRETELGMIAGNAAKTKDSSASNSDSVRFGTSDPDSNQNFIIGVNGAGGWGAGPAATFVKAGIKWDRIEFGMPDMNPPYQTVAQDTGYGLSVLGLINTSDSAALNTINVADYADYGIRVIKANPSINLWEVINEPYYKADRNRMDPVSYGKLYLALYNAVKSNGITGKTLLFNIFGDYSVSSGVWSQDANNGGWLRDATKGNPGLSAAIASQAYSFHPYGHGQPDENNADYYGLGSIAALENISKTVLGIIPPFYMTEHGYNLADSNDSHCSSAQANTAYLTAVSMNKFLADQHVRGVWWYSGHDDTTGQFGLMNSDSSVRPAFKVLSEFTDLHQHMPTCNS